MTGIQQAPTSRNIPAPVQRAVRQRCGFGCVVCGIPLYEYEHLLGWANVQRHVEEEITLLCDQHHRERTSGLLPLEAVREANQNPFNLRNGVSKPYALHFAGDRAEVTIGSNTFLATFAEHGGAVVPIVIDGVPIVSFKSLDGHLLLGLNLFDEHNHLVLQIADNQLVQSILPWDIQLVGTNLVVREAHRRILVDIHFEPPNRVIIARGRVLLNGVEVLVRPDHIELANNGTTLAGNRAENVPIGLMVGRPVPASALVSLPIVSRYRHDTSRSRAWTDNEMPESITVT